MTNLVILSGYLGKKPELKIFQDGNVICNASLGISETFKGRDGERKDKTIWVNLVLRGASAENFAKHFDKGSGVEIQGKLDMRNYEKDGIKQYVTEIQVSNWEFPKGKGKSEGSVSKNSNNSNHDDLNDSIPDFDDENQIPF